MAMYPTGIATNIGALLRKIQEERERMPHVIPPGTTPGAPMREMVVGPLMQVESPESARVISVRPEITPQAPGEVPRVVAPVAPVAPSPVAAGVSPAAPRVTPTPAPGIAPTPTPGTLAVGRITGRTPTARGVTVTGPRFGAGLPAGERISASWTPPAAELKAAPPRATFGGQPILRIQEMGRGAALGELLTGARALATRILPTLATRILPMGRIASVLAAEELAGKILKTGSLLKPRQAYSR